MSFNGIQGLLAQTAAPMVQDQVGSSLKTIILFGGLFAFMWFVMIAPQRKKAKEQDAMLKNLRAGDKVVTTSGIIGLVLSIKDKSVSIRSADSKFEVLKSSVSEVVERDAETSEVKS